MPDSPELRAAIQELADVVRSLPADQQRAVIAGLEAADSRLAQMADDIQTLLDQGMPQQTLRALYERERTHPGTIARMVAR